MQVPEDEVKPGAPEWVVTFGDMMSLLLTFFVLLLSFSTMEAQQFKMIAGYMREAFGLQTEHNYTGIPMGTTILSTEARQSTSAADQLDLVRLLRQEMEQAGIKRGGAVEVTEQGVVMRLEGELIFESGESGLKRETLELLHGIAEIAAARAGTIEIEGHTDDVPIRNSRFPSNWELSTSRAGAAARYLIQQGVPPSRIKAVGYADTRPLAPNTSVENRSLNRRVEFLFVNDPSVGDGSTIDPQEALAPAENKGAREP